MEAGVHVKRREKIAVVTLNRPDRLNAFNEALLEELEEATALLMEEPPRVLILTGAGKAFSAGFDVNPDNPMVSRLVDAVTTHQKEPARLMITRLRGIIDGFVTLPVPIIAALNGAAYGGGAELAARCDLRVMDPDAVISFSEVRLGLMPDWGGGATLAHLIGASRAADLILTAREIGAEEAFRMGVVDRVSEKGKTLDEAIRIAELISQNGPRAVRRALAVIRGSRNLTLDATLEMEASQAADLIAEGECVYGVSAFLEKKEPDFPD